MTKQYAVKSALTALALAVTLGVTGCGSNADAGSPGGMDHSSGSPMASPTSSPGASSSTPSPSASAAAQFNDADVSFVQMMLPHHEQAVAMSNTLLKKSGISPDTVALAKQVKAAQGPEITTMEGWLKAWGQQPMGDDMGGMDHGGGMGDGMATDAELRKFDQAKGAGAEKMYLQMMTAHHQGAIEQAQAQVENGTNPDAVELAKVIASTQQEEIDTMKKLLARL